jgi:excisionase family DNA binding protein
MASQEYVWIEDAARTYKRSRDWLYRQIRQGKLKGYTFPGDRKIYLSREEVEAYLLTPRALTDDDDEG